MPKITLLRPRHVWHPSTRVCPRGQRGADLNFVRKKAHRTRAVGPTLHPSTHRPGPHSGTPAGYSRTPSGGTWRRPWARVCATCLLKRAPSRRTRSHFGGDALALPRLFRKQRTHRHTRRLHAHAPLPTPLPSRRPLAFFFRRARFCKHPSRQHLDTPSRQHLDTHSLQTQLTTESLHALRSLEYNNLDADAKRALTEANTQRRTPLELKL